jgi:hypothetical protein
MLAAAGTRTPLPQRQPLPGGPAPTGGTAGARDAADERNERTTWAPRYAQRVLYTEAGIPVPRWRRLGREPTRAARPTVTRDAPADTHAYVTRMQVLPCTVCPGAQSVRMKQTKKKTRGDGAGWQHRQGA